MKSFIRYWLPPVLLCGIIFFQSCFATPKVLPSWPLQDKCFHLGVYALLGALWARAFNTLPSWRGRTGSLLLISIVLTTFYGFSDEWHQSFVAARSSELADILADFIGGTIGGFLFIKVGIRRNKSI
jgi:VanZ family protein